MRRVGSLAADDLAALERDRKGLQPDRLAGQSGDGRAHASRPVATVPLGRAGLPMDMGAAAVYLSSPGASFVTGVNLVVDGGESLW